MTQASRKHAVANANKNARRWEAFNKTFWAGYNGDDGDGPVNFMWFDKLGTFELKNNIVVEIELETCGRQDQHEGYMVRLIHKSGGKLTQHYFKFDDYLEEREDDRTDYPLGDNHCFYVDDKADWYIATPTFDDVVEYQTTLMSFISEYGEAKSRR